MRKAALWLCLALAFMGLVSCSEGKKNTCEVTVNGELGAPVTLSDVECSEGAGRLTKETVHGGRGNKIFEGQTALMRATSFDSRTGEIIKAYDTGELQLAVVSKEGMGDLAKQVVGAREGSRIVIKRPGLVGGVPNATEIIVVDLLYTIAKGKAVPVPNPAPAGMPQVGTADAGGPSIAAPGGSVPVLATVPLVVGEGAQVTQGQTLAVQYAIFDQDGKSIDETWTKSGPVPLNLKKAMVGLSEGLVDQKIGSRVVVLIPSAKAQGTGSRVAVVDILGVLPESASKKTTPTPSGRVSSDGIASSHDPGGSRTGSSGRSTPSSAKSPSPAVSRTSR